MTNLHLVGPTGFLGESFCRLEPDLISVGRAEPKNLVKKHVKIGSNFDFSTLDNETLDCVIFLIGSSDHEVINNHPTLAMEMNVLPLANFLYYCSQREQRPRKIITFTTMLQYDANLMTLPCDETQPVRAATNNYVLSKVTAEHTSELYRKYFDIIDVRLSNVYGPTHLKRPDIVPSLIEKILHSAEVSVWTKKPVRDFVYVDDVVRSVIMLCETDFSGPINIGSGVPRSVGDLCDILQRLSGREIFSENRDVTGHMEYYHDINLLKSLVKFDKAIPLEVGLFETFNYAKKIF